MKEKIHPPYNKLKGYLREQSLTYSDIADILDISITAVNHKINGSSDFYVSEAKKIMNIFKTNADIFFTSKVS